MFCLRNSSFMRSMVCSASAFTASCTCTSSTMWLPPFRSRPSRILFCRFCRSSAFDFGTLMMPYTQTRIVTTITTVLAVKFVFMGVSEPSIECQLLRCARFFVRAKTGNRAARHLKLDVVRLHADHQGIVFVDGHNGPDHAAAGHHRVSVLQGREHLLLLLALPLHGTKKKEVHDRDHQRDLNVKTGGDSGRRRRSCLQKKT